MGASPDGEPSTFNKVSFENACLSNNKFLSNILQKIAPHLGYLSVIRTAKAEAELFHRFQLAHPQKFAASASTSLLSSYRYKIFFNLYQTSRISFQFNHGSDHFIGKFKLTRIRTRMRNIHSRIFHLVFDIIKG